MKFFIGLFLVFCGLLTSACGTALMKPVSESQRAKNNQYDGRYIGTLQQAAREQRRGDWRLTCEPLDLEFGLIVENSQIILPWDENLRKTTYINDAGKFKFQIRINERARSSLGSDTSLNSRAKIIISGSLADNSLQGQWISAIEQLGDTGCTYPIRYERYEETKPDERVI